LWEKIGISDTGGATAAGQLRDSRNSIVRPIGYRCGIKIINDSPKNSPNLNKKLMNITCVLLFEKILSQRVSPDE
jgi:hypothetical protein